MQISYSKLMHPQFDVGKFIEDDKYLEELISAPSGSSTWPRKLLLSVIILGLTGGLIGALVILH